MNIVSRGDTANRTPFERTGSRFAARERSSCSMPRSFPNGAIGRRAGRGVRGDLRNEAIWGLGGLVVRGWGGGGVGGAGGLCGLFGNLFGLFSNLFDFLGLETLELLEGVAIVAVGHIDAALEAGGLVAGFGGGHARRSG